MRSASICVSQSTAHLNGLQAPAMRGVHASLNHIAASIVIICVAVSIVIIVVVWIVTAEAEAASEVAVMVEAATTVEVATTVEAATRLAATETTVMERHAAAECAGAEATMEATTAKAAGMETAATTTKAAAVETAPATTKAAATASVSAAAATASVSAAASAASAATARQRHGWRGQTNRRNCQQRDHCFTQHCHSPSDISLLDPHRRWQSLRRNATGFDITVTQLRARE
jgi:hypothetical protein